MDTHATFFPLRASVAAVHAALLTLALAPTARADEPLDPAVAALVEPQSRIEVGVGSQSNGSFKANEYTGLSHKGAFPIANFDVRMGGAYGSDDPARLRLRGANLGTDAQSLNVDYTVQGRYRVSFGYDEFRRNRSDSYQTPLLGAGGSVLTLPGNWLVPVVPRLSGTAANARGLSPDVTASNGLVAGVPTAPTPAQAATAAALQAADLPAFHDVALSTKRTRYELGLGYAIDRHWELSANFRHEERNGLKPMGSITRATGGDISTTIPDLIDQSTDLVHLGVQYRGDKLVVQAGYDGSAFTNKVTGMTWSNWALPGNAQTMSSAPSNEFHQLNLTAHYAFTPTTRLLAAASYGRSTQNDPFLTASYTPLVPVSSLEGLVVTKTASLKLSARPVSDLRLNAGYKFDERDNRSAVHTFGFYDAGEAATGTSLFAAYFPGVALGANANLNANRPYSRRLHQFSADADYQVVRGQNLQAGVETEDTDRYCNGTWIACVDANHTRENTVRLEWRSRIGETLSGRLALARSDRKVDYNEDAWLALVPAAALSPTGAPGGATAYGTLLALGLTGYGPISGLNPLPTPGSAAAFFFANNNALANGLYGNQNRISELPGMRRYDMADRTRDKLRLSLEWQATESLTLQAGYDGNLDDYRHSVYGLQKSQRQGLNIDATLALAETTSLNAFATRELLRSHSAGNSYTANSTATAVNGFTVISGGCFATIAERNANNKVDPCLNWSADMRDTVDTLGAAFTRRDLAGGKLDLSGGLSYSRARSTNEVNGGNYANNPLAVAGAAPGTIAAYYIAASALPEVTTRITELKLGARYALNKSSAVRVGYSYQHMSSSDWAYDGLQPGGLAGVLPTYEQAPSYTVHTIAVAYLYSFR